MFGFNPDYRAAHSCKRKHSASHDGMLPGATTWILTVLINVPGMQRPGFTESLGHPALPAVLAAADQARNSLRMRPSMSSGTGRSSNARMVGARSMIRGPGDRSLD
jgi:hypothetical protein